MAKKNIKSESKKKNGKAVAPANTPDRELTRAQKTAMARDAAAKRNAARVSPPSTTTTQPSKSAKGKKSSRAVKNSGKNTVTSEPSKQVPLTRAQKTALARETAAKRNTPAKAPETAAQTAKKPTARRTVGAKANVKRIQQDESRKEINRKINTQTPARRTEARSGKRVSGSIKNIEIKSHSKTSKNSFRVKRKKKGTGRLLLSRLILFFVIFIIMFSLVAGLFTLSLHSGKSLVGKEYTLRLGEEVADVKTATEEEKPVYVEIPKNCAVRYGNLYIPVSALTDMCQLTVTGTLADLRYLPRGSGGHSMRFVVDSDIAYVNGAKVRMISPSFIYEGKLYIPVDFMQKYSKGLAIEIDEGNRLISVSKLLEGYDAATDSNIYSNLTFSLSLIQPLTPVSEPTE